MYRAAVAIILLAVATTARADPLGLTVDFEFEDARYLCPGEHLGGRIYVSQAVSTTPVPLLVFLHGNNQRGPVHRWLGGGGDDLRARIADSIDSSQLPPMIIAAPSQTCGASVGRYLWPEFDLDAFVDASERAVREWATISRDAVIIAGHSGAGCNLSGGLLKIAADRGVVRPIGLVAIDTCMNREVARALAHADASTTVAAYWQTATWRRDFGAFEGELRSARAPAIGDWLNRVEINQPNPHDGVVGPSLLEALRRMLGDGRARSATE